MNVEAVLNRLSEVKSEIVSIVERCRNDAVRIVEDSNLPESVKKRLIDEINSYWFGTDSVVDGLEEILPVIIEVIEKKGRYRMNFEAYVEDGELFEKLLDMLDSAQREELRKVASRLNDLALRMYSNIFKLLGFEVKEGEWTLILQAGQ